MRPRKILLIIDANADRASVLSFTIKIKGYRCLTANGLQEAIAAFSNSDVSLVLSHDDLAIEKLKQIKPYVPMILFGTNTRTIPDSMIDPKRVTTAELLERIKVMAQRKRGPRKGSESAMRCGSRVRTGKGIQ